MSRSLAFSSLIAVTLAAALPAFAATLSPSAIIANPSSFDGTTVTVAGTVAQFQRTHTLMGTVSAYQLCDTKCIVVIDQKNGTQQDGAKATVSGTFHVQYKGPRRTFKNVVMLK
jgi:hypothetical protein